MMLVTYEVLNEDTLPILEQLERLQLLRRMPLKPDKNQSKRPSKRKPAKEILQTIVQNQKEEIETTSGKKAVIPLRKKSLAGSLSPETAKKLLEHVENARNEWEHRI